MSEGSIGRDAERARAEAQIEAYIGLTNAVYAAMDINPDKGFVEDCIQQALATWTPGEEPNE